MDERSMTRLLPGSLLLGEAPYNGATNLSASAMWLAWEWLWGLSPRAVRSFSVAAGLLSLFYFFRLIKDRESKATALWATALFAVSFNATYFSSVAMETHFPLLWGPLLALGYLHWREAPTVARSLWLGLVFALSLFTYPGQVLAAMAYLPTVAYLYWCQRRLPAVSPAQRKGMAIFLGTAFLVCAGMYWIHVRLAITGEPLWLQNTYRLPDTPLRYVTALAMLVAHGFLGAGSGMPGYPMPLFEVLLWPFFIVGTAVWWRRSTNPWLRALPLCLVPAVLIAALASRAPATRRFIFFLPIFYFLCALGIGHLLARFRRPWLGAAFAAILALPFIHYHWVGNQPESYRLEAFWTKKGTNEHYPMPDAAVLASLARGDITIGGPTRILEQQYLSRLQRLGEFVGDLKERHQIHYTDAPMPASGCSDIPPYGRQLFWCGYGLIYRREGLDQSKGRMQGGEHRHLFVKHKPKTGNG